MNRTRLAARQLNRERARYGPTGDLVALRFTGETKEDPNLYDSLKTYPEVAEVNGWGAETVRGDDGGLFTRITIADEDGELAALVDDLEDGLTDFAIGGRIFKLEPDQTERPLRAPFIWTFRASVTPDTFEEEAGG